MLGCVYGLIALFGVRRMLYIHNQRLTRRLSVALMRIMIVAAVHDNNHRKILDARAANDNTRRCNTGGAGNFFYQASPNSGVWGRKSSS